MNSLKRIAFQSLVLGLGLLASSMWVQAASFRVNPVGLTLSAEHATAVLKVINDGSASTVIQLQTVAWSQDKGKDVYVPTRELLATPPIFTVAAGAQQLVRVGLRVAADARQEKATACSLPKSHRRWLRDSGTANRPAYQHSDFLGAAGRRCV